jgi:TolB-like protein/DNA-binding winged helix-turn-helix (wHTH) protein
VVASLIIMMVQGRGLAPNLSQYVAHVLNTALNYHSIISQLAQSPRLHALRLTMGDVYRFGPFVMDPEEHVLTRDGTPIPITRKASDILLYLVQHPNRVVAKQDLMKAVWPDTFVEEGNLTQHISLLRKALAEHGDGLIVTVARQGYRFTGDVTIANGMNPALTTPTGPQRARGRDRRWRTVAALGAVVLLVSLGAAIVWQRSRVTSRGTIRLAVLPFDNLTGDPGQDYLADGLTEELITQLARLHPEQLDVIARTSVMAYKHSGKRIDEIGRELSVRYAVESSLRRSGDRVRVTVQLIRVQGQSHLWSQEFDYVPQDFLHFEDAVAAAVTREVQLRLTPEERARLTRSASANAGAVDAFLRGRDVMQFRSGKEGWEAANRDFNQAIALDSGYALAWAWLALVDRVGVDKGFLPADEGIRGARLAVQRALDLDPNLPEAYGQLGQIQRLVDWNWAAANESFQRALTLDSGNVQALERAAGNAGTLGHLAEAIALTRRAVDLDPLDATALTALGQNYYYAGRLDEAAKCIENVPPDLRSPLVNQILAQVYLAQGRMADAMVVVEHESADPAWQLLGRSLVYFRQRRQHAADSTVAEYVARYGAQAAYEVAEIYAFRGEPDSAFAWLERAYDQRDEGLAAVRIDPLLEQVRGDPRYAALLTKMQLPL